MDGLIAGAGGGGGYTDTQIDNFLNLKEDKSAFTDNVSFSQLIYQDLLLYLVINLEQVLIGLYQYLKNQTNYITLQGNKIIANATSDDSLTSSNLNPSNDAVVMNKVVNNLVVSGTTTLDDLSVNGNAYY